jgi:nucleoside-diphosphate-sugar epimerase
MTARGNPLTLPALGVFDGVLSYLGDAFRLQAPPAHLLLLPERRAVTIFLVAPLSRYGFLAPLSFFVKAEFGFKAKTKFEDGLRKTIDWYLARKKGVP